MGLVSLVYFSQHRLDTRSASMGVQLDDILVSATRNNAARGITGALVFDSEHFVQVLEGELDVVWATFRKLEQDERHHNVQFVEMEALPNRYFGNWAMGCGERNHETSKIFAPYLRGGKWVPGGMTGTELLSLLMDLRRNLSGP